MSDQHCPVCRIGATQAHGTQTWCIGGQTYRLCECAACGSAFTAPLPNDSALKTIYGSVFDYRWYQDHYDVKLDDCRTRVKEYDFMLGRRVLDFGGGIGYFAQAVAETGRTSMTFDPYVEAKSPERGCWDSVVALHVLEHSNDLDRTMDEIKGFLVPGGRLILAVPNFASLGYRERGMDWVWAQPPLVHIFHLTARGLAALLTRHGFTDIETSFHERWDANLYCDFAHAEEFRQHDALWSLRPLKPFVHWRRWVARRNARLRFAGLEIAMRDFDSQSDIYAELQVSAVLGP